MSESSVFGSFVVGVFISRPAAAAAAAVSYTAAASTTMASSYKRQRV